MISPIAPKKALTSAAVAPAMPTRQESSAVKRFQEMDELSPMGLMWQLVKDAMGIRSQAAPAFKIPLQTPPSIEAAVPTYRIQPFKVRLQQRLNQVEPAVSSTPVENPFALLPLQWASAPPLQSVVRQDASQSQESVWF